MSVKNWLKQYGFDLSANDLSKIYINQALRKDPNTVKKITLNRGSSVQAIVDHYLKLNEDVE